MGAKADRPMLLCYDGSEPARRAIAAAGGITGGPALVLSAWESLDSVAVPVPALAGAVLGGAGKLDEESASVAAELADQGVAAAAAAGFDAQPLPVRADRRIWRAILDAAEEHDARVIVLGSRGRSAIESAVLGSVAYRVVHHARCPVLVVPPDPAN